MRTLTPEIKEQILNHAIKVLQEGVAIKVIDIKTAKEYAKMLEEAWKEETFELAEE